MSETKEPILSATIHTNMDQAPTLPIRWCLNKDTVDMMQEKNIMHPMVLISILKEHPTRGWEDVDRHLVPVDQMMHYVSFNSPGRHKVNISIVTYDGWKDNELSTCKSVLRDKWLDKYEGSREYKNSLVGSSGEPKYIHTLELDPEYEPLSEAYKILERGWPGETIDISVDANLFAPEPPRWLKSWVNWMFPERPVDQCSFRRRFIFAFTVQPFIFLVVSLVLWMIKGFIAFSALFAGHRGINWKAVLFHSYPIKDVVEKQKVCYPPRRTNFYFEDKEGKPYNAIILALATLVYPPFLLILATIVYYANWILSDNMLLWDDSIIWSALQLFGIAFAIVLCGVGLFFAMAAILPQIKGFENWAGIADKIGAKFVHWKKSWEEWREERSERKAKEKHEKEEREKAQALSDKYERLQSEYVCTGEPLEASYEALPKANKTFWLGYKDLKMKICKPFKK